MRHVTRIKRLSLGPTEELIGDRLRIYNDDGDLRTITSSSRHHSVASRVWNTNSQSRRQARPSTSSSTQKYNSSPSNRVRIQVQEMISGPAKAGPEIILWTYGDCFRNLPRSSDAR